MLFEKQMQQRACLQIVISRLIHIIKALTLGVTPKNVNF